MIKGSGRAFSTGYEIDSNKNKDEDMIESATSLDAIFHFTPVTQKFQRDARELGLKAALEAKDGLFRGRTFIDLAGLTK
ncbi:MAG: hypothetical protein ACYC2T_04155 [Bacillota bacterium]